MSSSRNLKFFHSNESSIELDYVSTHTRSGKTVLLYKKGELICRLCDMSFGLDQTLYQAHLNVHRQESILLLKEDGLPKPDDAEEIIKASTGLVKLWPQSGKCKLTCSSGQDPSSLSMQLEHRSSHSIQLTDIFLFNDAVAFSAIQILVTLAPGEKLDFKHTLINAALDPSKINDYVVRYLELPLKTELIEVHRLKRCCLSFGSLKSKGMIEYKSDSAKMTSIVENLKGKSVIPCSLNPSNYVATLKQFIQLEEYANDLELHSFNCEITLTKLTLKSLSMPHTFSITIPKVLTKFPKLKEMDRFWMCPKGDGNIRNNVNATVTNILSNEIHIRCLKKEPIADRTYKIEFILNRSQIQMEHRALDTMHTFKLIEFLFPEPLPPFRAGSSAIVGNMQWYNKTIKSNTEQHDAVLNIVNGVSYPAPYLIFGPPGTGKTATVTEAICQLLRTQPQSRILVTATSNAAADELALRLFKYVHTGCYFQHNVYRLYAANVQREVTDTQLLANSNYQLRSLPTWEILSKYRVLICTLTTAGRLNLAPPSKSDTHFTHLFVDECGSATETAALIPIAVCSSRGKINVHVILSGDPKQLGPVIISKTAEKMGFGQSLLARLMNRDTYKRNLNTGTYCRRMLTQLVQNFRSHPNIINISNRLFYNNELVACAPKDKTNCYLGWSKLPVKDIPIVFDVTVGTALKEENSTSWFNNKEVKKVIKYVNVLLKNGINGKRITEDDIGIISPYVRQCQKIEMVLRQCGHKIMSSSVELFQGKEKPVIIVSTVRTGRQGIGFLDSAQRLNVLLTRAQALMILIGDPNVLQKDRNWYDMLKHLSKLNVMIGTEFVLSATRPPSSIEAENISTEAIHSVPIPTKHIPITASIRSVPIATEPIRIVPKPTEAFRSVPIPTKHIIPITEIIRSVPIPTEPIWTVPIPTEPSRSVPVPTDYEYFHRRLVLSSDNILGDSRWEPRGTPSLADRHFPRKPVASRPYNCCTIL